MIAVIAKNKLSWNIHRSDQGIGTLGYFYTTTDSFCAATIIIPDQASGHSHERLWRRDTWRSEAAPRQSRRGSVTLLTYQIGFVPHFGAVLTPIRIVAEANNYEREMEPTETEVNIQERGLEFSAPNPLGQPFRHDVWYVGTTQARGAKKSYSTGCERCLKSSEKSQRAHRRGGKITVPEIRLLPGGWGVV